MACDFCKRDGRVILENRLAYSMWDRNPASEGHALVIPVEHIEDISKLSGDEVLAMYEILKKTLREIKKIYNPDGYNIGFNLRPVAGQTMPHIHEHIIPRYIGDVKDPVGGIRRVLPCRGHR